MAKQSAGILVYRFNNQQLEVLLAHNGGPFFARKDNGWWTIPKGLIEPDEDPVQAAKREFKEETGIDLPAGDLTPLGSVRQRNNKDVHAWAIEADIDVSHFVSNTFSVEWPPKSGKTEDFPEIDKVQWFNLKQAKVKANSAQVELIDRLVEHLGFDDVTPEQINLL